ncbi:MAG: fluoride efflux transporter CrcB [Hamadaea sp.]|uniref:fluoride efflux transporter CrcB n=1 Tax=Hamadaea sp. TaxID=2024425 RepID=UPI0017B2D6D5|nr:fluoride efflux transporter CrcB [Hamadaea sp.]NUR73855.1 fluoride efflux transporter CrcB [Hamadaea sp.]NUT18980.1 fluoride efflux transporter CrcB [Hamadaea sp.]
MTWLLVALGAAVGAPLRYLTDRMVQARHDSVFPWGTFAVNITGSFILGLITASTLHASAPVLALVGTGLCGALTTYSTFGYETLRLFQEKARSLAVLNAVASVVAGLGAAYAGAAVAQALGG